MSDSRDGLYLRHVLASMRDVLIHDYMEALEPFLEEVWKVSWALKTHAGGPGGPKTKDEILGILQDLEKGHADFQGLSVTKKLSSDTPSERTATTSKRRFRSPGLTANRTQPRQARVSFEVRSLPTGSACAKVIEGDIGR